MFRELIASVALALTFCVYSQDLAPVTIQLGQSQYTVASRFFPPMEPKQKTVLILHDTFNHQDSYSDLAKYLQEKGFHVLTFDLLGWGRSMPLKKSETGFAGFQRGVISEIEQARTQIREMLFYARSLAPENKHYLLSEGLSSLLVHDFLNQENEEKVAGTVFIRPLKSDTDIKKQTGFKNYSHDQFVIPKLPRKTRHFFQSLGKELNRSKPTTHFIQTKRYYAFMKNDPERNNHDYLDFLYHHYHNASADFTDIKLLEGESTLDSQALSHITNFLLTN